MLTSIAVLALAFLPQSPDTTLPPEGAHLAITAEGFGVQTYHCTPESDGTFTWVFDSADATLFNRATHAPLGKLSANPITFRWDDGSVITGKIKETTPSSNATNIPSLLFTTQSSGTQIGALTGVTLVRRDNTQAGAAPNFGCYAEKANNLIHVPFEATYTFYTTQQQPTQQ